MGHLNIENFSDYREEKLLQEALYTVECIDSEEMSTRKGSSMLRLRLAVVDGPAQEGGRSPVGIELTDFIVLDAANAKDEKAADFIRRKAGQVFEAFGVTVADGEYDEHDFVGRQVIAKVRPGEDQDGFPVNTISRYKKLS